MKGLDDCSAHEIVRGSRMTVRCIHCMCSIAVTTLRKTLSGPPLNSCMWGVAETAVWSTAPSGLRKDGRCWVLLRFAKMLSKWYYWTLLTARRMLRSLAVLRTAWKPQCEYL